MELQALLEKSSRRHSHLCPRQVLGVRIGLAGLAALGFGSPPGKTRLLVISETDGCFVDGITAAANCTVGHRDLRVEDYGKVAAVFTDPTTRQSLRIAPALDVRQRAHAYAPHEPRPYYAQLHAYQVMPEAELLSFQPVELVTPVEAILSRHGGRVNCVRCGEEIINQRQVMISDQVYCQACANGGYYMPLHAYSLYTPSPAHPAHPAR